MNYQVLIQIISTLCFIAFMYFGAVALLKVVKLVMGWNNPNATGHEGGGIYLTIAIAFAVLYSQLPNLVTQ